SQAGVLLGAIGSTAWNLFEAVGRFDDERREAGRAIRARVAEALEADELALPLAQALRGAQDDAVRLLAPPAAETTPPAGPSRAERWREIQAETRVPPAEGSASLRKYLESLNQRQRERVRVSWRVEDKD